MADYRREDVAGFRYEIVKPLGVLSRRTIQGKPWTLEANIIAWNGKAPKIDVRSWDKEHKVMSKGVTLTRNEALELAEIIIRGFASDNGRDD